MKGRNHDNDRGYRSPRAWWKLKQALDGMSLGLPELAHRLERLSDEHGYCVRLVLAAALHAFAAMTTEEQKHALMDSCGWDRKSPPRRRSRPAPVQPPAEKPAAPAPTNGDADDDDDDEGEEWKRGGVAEWPAAGANLPAWLTWIRELVLLPYGTGGGRRLIRVGSDAHRIEATPDIRLSELRDAIAKRLRTAPTEDLPEGERVSDAVFFAAMWKATAPAGMPVPPNLPDGATLELGYMDGDSPRPPTISSGKLSAPREWRHHCPVCGKGYVMSCYLRQHLIKKHGWAEGEHFDLIPPAKA